MEDQLDGFITDDNSLAGETALLRHSSPGMAAFLRHSNAGETAFLHYSSSDTAVEGDIRESRRSEAGLRASLRGMLKSATDGKLVLCDSPRDLPARMLAFAAPIALTDPGAIRRLRRITEDAARAISLSEAQIMDFDLAAGEAAMNAFVHAGSGTATVSLSRENGFLHVWIEDQGTGISLEHLPRATLEKGFTTAGTFGHGFKIILKTVDRLWLLTGDTGTTVVLEQRRAGSRA
jgi:anti-sigma regulatory factor (Ser/Thr protein kinase)